MLIPEPSITLTEKPFQSWRRLTCLLLAMQKLSVAAIFEENS